MIMQHWIDKLTYLKKQFLKNQKPVADSIIPTDFTQQQNLMTSCLDNVVEFLKKTTMASPSGDESLKELPWYLFIGAPASGKTSLLAHSDASFTLKRKFETNKLLNLKPSKHCDFWAAQHAVFVDVPGKYTIRDKEVTVHNKLWQYLLHLLLRENAASISLNGVVIFLSVEDLFDKQKQKQILNQMRYVFASLKTYQTEDLSIHLMITKCDYLPGFLDFFGDDALEETAQIFGISLPRVRRESVITIFEDRFNALIKRLNNQLINRLHTERLAAMRFKIKDFPLQMERLKEELISFFKELNSKQRFHIDGIYLSSAVQQSDNQTVLDEPETLALIEIKHQTQLFSLPQIESRPYFIKQFIMHVLKRPIDKSLKKSYNLLGPKALAASFALLALISAVDFWQTWNHYQGAKKIELAEVTPSVKTQTIIIPTQFA